MLLDWWKGQNVKKRFIWPGLAAYRIGSTPAFTADEIVSQIGAYPAFAVDCRIYLFQSAIFAE